ncbi:MAG: hypothetical protein ACOY94_22490 [Bacillota bacterium]
MSDWREKLAGLGRELQAKEQVVAEQKVATLRAFRQRLEDLKPVLEGVEAFGDAFGVEVDFTISRFDDRYPYLEFRIIRPPLFLRIECRDGVIRERLKEGVAAPTEAVLSLEALSPKRVEQRLNSWMQAAAQANRRVPGRRF